MIEEKEKLQLVYTIFCDDVRFEMGNKLSFMGVFQNIMVQQFPVSLYKFAVVNQWRGEGAYLSEVRILTPDHQQPVIVSQPTRIEIAAGAFANNISFFGNVVFNAPGNYWVQTLIDSSLFSELPISIVSVNSQPNPLDVTDAVN